LKRLKINNYEPVISKDRNGKMLESKDKEYKTISFGDVGKLNKFKNTNAKSSLSQMSSLKDGSSSKSSNIWKLSNNELSLKKSKDTGNERIDYIQSNTTTHIQNNNNKQIKSSKRNNQHLSSQN